MRVLRALAVASLAVALTGAASMAVALTTGAAAHADCAKPTHGCHESTFSCACCIDSGGRGEQTPALPSSDRASVSKAPIAPGLVAPAIALFGEAPLARLLNPPSRHRAGPPRSLSILNAALLL